VHNVVGDRDDDDEDPEHDDRRQPPPAKPGHGHEGRDAEVRAG
jgi:hypothetical protein